MAQGGTAQDFARLSSAFWEAYAVPLMRTGDAVLATAEAADLPLSRDDFAAIAALREKWTQAWRNFQAGTAEWISAADALNWEALTDADYDLARGAFNAFKGHRDEALAHNDQVAADFEAWAARAAAAAPEPGMAAAIIELAKAFAASVPDAISLWPLVPIGLGALALLWFFGRPKRAR